MLYNLLLASVLAHTPMDAVTAGTQGCAAARALVTESSMSLDEGRCKKLTSAKLEVGAADLYRVSDGDNVRFALEITDAKGHRWMAGIDLDPGKYHPHLRVIAKSSFALDVAHHYLLCTEDDGAWSCASASGHSLGDNGVVHE